MCLLEIHNDDCLSVMEGMEEHSIDVIVTSPPYNLGKHYHDYCDSVPWDAYYHSMGMRIEAMSRVLKWDGSLFFNYGHAPANPVPTLMILEMLNRWFTLQNIIIWVKSLAVDGVTKGHYRPISSERFLNHNWEIVVHATMTGDTPIDRKAVGVPYVDKSNIERWATDEDKHCAGDVWFIPYDTVQTNAGGKFGHPSIFPVELARRCIKLHGVSEGMKVFDPFMGVGATLVACAELGVDGIGAEVVTKYCEDAMKRLPEAVMA